MQPDAVVMVDNGGRGPCVMDTRNLPAGDWLLEGCVPTGTVAAIADLDDPPTATLFEAGFEVVIRMHGKGDMIGYPVKLSVEWRPGLVPGHEPPAPFWAMGTTAGFERVEVGAGAR